MIPPLTVRPVLHTDHLDHWGSLLEALGARRLSADPLWTEYELDRGRVTLTALNRGAHEGEVSLGFETTDLDGFAAAVAPTAGMRVDLLRTDDHTSVRVVGRDGLEVLVDRRPEGGPLPDRPAAWVHALWISPDVAGTAEDLEALGLHRRLTETNGRTIDLRAAEGDVLVHVSDDGPVGANVAVDVVDLDAAHKAFLDAGIAHDVIDETSGRTLQVPFPGEGDGVFWVTQEDDDPVGAVRH